MKTLLLAFISLVTFDVSATAMAALEAGPKDFQDLVQKLGGQVPFPPEKLVGALRALDPQSKITATIIPHGRGRSIVRGDTDYNHPRNVVNWSTGSSTLPFELYFGYAKTTEMLEIMSFDREKHRFEFFLVKNYKAGTKPDVNALPLETCTVRPCES